MGKMSSAGRRVMMQPTRAGVVRSVYMQADDDACRQVMEINRADVSEWIMHLSFEHCKGHDIHSNRCKKYVHYWNSCHILTQEI